MKTTALYSLIKLAAVNRSDDPRVPFYVPRGTAADVVSMYQSTGNDKRIPEWIDSSAPRNRSVNVQFGGLPGIGPNSSVEDLDRAVSDVAHEAKLRYEDDAFNTASGENYSKMVYDREHPDEVLAARKAQEQAEAEKQRQDAVARARQAAVREFYTRKYVREHGFWPLEIPKHFSDKDVPAEIRAPSDVARYFQEQDRAKADSQRMQAEQERQARQDEFAKSISQINLGENTEPKLEFNPPDPSYNTNMNGVARVKPTTIQAKVL